MKYDFEELMQENMNIQESPSKELNERILHYDREERRMDKRRKFMQQMPKVAAAVLTIVLLSGGIAYASSGLWNRFVAKEFGVGEDHKTMKDMKDKGFAQQPHAKGLKGGQLSVTDKDITVTLLQTLADERSAYVCYEVKYGEQYEVVKEGATEDSPYGILRPQWTYLKLASGKEMNSMGGVSKIVDDHTILYEESLTLVNSEDRFEDERMTMSISAFEMDKKKCDDNPDVIVKDGKWELSWKLSVGTEKRVYHLDRTLTLGEARVVLKDLEITPLSYNLTVEYPDDVSLDEIAALVETDDRGIAKVEDLLDENGDMKVIRYLYTGGGENVDKMLEQLPEGQTLLFLGVDFRLGDKDFDGNSGMSIMSKFDENYLYGQFEKVLNLEELSGVRVAGKYIDLTEISYKTIQ